MQCGYSEKKKKDSIVQFNVKVGAIVCFTVEVWMRCVGPDGLRGKANSCPCALFIHHWPFCVTVLCVLLNEWKRNKLISIAQSHLITFRPKAAFYLTPQTKGSLKAEAVFHFYGSDRWSSCCSKVAWWNLGIVTETVEGKRFWKAEVTFSPACNGAALHNCAQQG